MRRLIFSIGAFLSPPFFLVLLIWLYSVVPSPLIDFISGKWKSLGVPGQSVGGAIPSGMPGRFIISADGTADELYASTSDKRIFVLRGSYSETPVWSEIIMATDFEHPPQVFALCGLLVADGNKLYSFENHTTAQISHPLIGPIRDIIKGPNGILIEGETQILYSSNCGKTWQELWSGPPLESNIAIYNDVLVVSNGKLMARSWHFNNNRTIWDDWRDISGALAGKPISFLAVGGYDWVIAATQNEVYRSPEWSIGNWEPFNIGLPNPFRVEGIGRSDFEGQIGLGLITDHGLFTYSHGPQWLPVLGLGQPISYVDAIYTMIESSSETAYVISDKGIWSRTELSTGLGGLFTGIEFLFIAALVLLLTIVLGFILAVRVWGRY
jgi:hypothetical protein